MRIQMQIIDTKNNEFRVLLQQELSQRVQKNPHYSLRSFARDLNFDHSALSSILSGKRNITTKTVAKLAPKLNIKPRIYMNLLNGLSFVDAYKNHEQIQEAHFTYMSDWTFDAVLELTRVQGFKFSEDSVAKKLRTNKLYARTIIQTLLSLNLLVKTKSGYKLAHKRSTNLIDNEHTSVALRKYQKSLLEKSITALETIDRSQRDHTSSVFAINKQDVAKVKKIIQKFRHELSEFVQRKDSSLNDVYALQVSFFPLTESKED